MDTKKLRIFGLILIIGLAIVGLNFVPDDEAATTVKKQSVERRVANLEAFGRLYGYVRYFHPSDESAGLNWDRFAVYGAGRVKDAADDEELQKVLKELFLPIAPSLVITEKGKKAPKSPAPQKTTEVVAWQHYGPPGTDTQFFKSNRVHAFLVDGTYAFDERMLFANYPVLGQKHDGTLSERLRFSMPLILYVENGKTLGTTEKSWNRFVKLKEELASMDPNLTSEDEDVRFAGVITTWNILAHFHPSDPTTARKIRESLAAALKEAADDRTREDYLETLAFLLEKTGDGMAENTFISEYSPWERLPFTLDIIEGKLVVTAADEMVNVKAGDIVEKINGAGWIEYLDKEINKISGSTQFKIWRAIDLITQMDEVKLGITRDGLYRDVTVDQSRYGYMDEFNRTVTFKELEEGIYYINMTDDARRAVEANVDALRKAKGIVFDLRNSQSNGEITGKIISQLLDKPIKGPILKIMQTVYPYQWKATYDEIQNELTPEPRLFKGKAVFLAYSGTRAQAETILGYVKDNGLGTIVGQNTAGAHGYLQMYPINGTLRGVMTGTETLSANGKSTFKLGIKPDVHVFRTMDGVRNGSDEYLEKAIEVIEGK
ncbi:S41 family peptidase [Neobacillus sp. YIM B06451]|uniref:S41 family peptidase n=1 Tax=Neobacillus sp. YIM B06451 TaxID=3070994 RepID=UPI00292CFFF3|nr:S41 family peptidase [Neobacillus sp. YIM B06451]